MFVWEVHPEMEACRECKPGEMNVFLVDQPFANSLNQGSIAVSRALVMVIIATPTVAEITKRTSFSPVVSFKEMPKTLKVAPEEPIQ